MTGNVVTLPLRILRLFLTLPEATRAMNGNSFLIEKQSHRSADGRSRKALSRSCQESYMKDYVKILLKSERSFFESPRNFRTNAKARSIVVDWLVHVHDKYELAQTALHKTISLMDDFSSKRHVHNSNLQLVGIACMSLTIKNAGTPIESSLLVAICGSHFTKEDLHKMELEVLQMAKFDLNRPVAPQFFLILEENYNVPENAADLTRYFLDLWLFYGSSSVKHRPSVVAASCLLLALQACKEKGNVAKWFRLLTNLFEFSEAELTTTILAIFKIFDSFEHNIQPAIQHKYPGAHYQEAATRCRDFKGIIHRETQ